MYTRIIQCLESCINQCLESERIIQRLESGGMPLRTITHVALMSCVRAQVYYNSQMVTCSNLYSEQDYLWFPAIYKEKWRY